MTYTSTERLLTTNILPTPKPNDMKKIIEKIMIATAVVATALPAAAQSEAEIKIGTDIVNQYIWRGQKLGDVSLQPTLGVEYKGFSLTAWGSVGLSNYKDTKEFDLTLAYSIGGFNIGITDYWFDTAGNKYFRYNAHSTAHVFEGNIGYDFGVVNFQWYTNFAGNDARNKKGKMVYSSYAELKAPFDALGCAWEAAIGCVPYKTAAYSEANGFAVTNVSLKASKELAITDKFKPSVFAGIAANPSNEAAYLLCGITIEP